MKEHEIVSAVEKSAGIEGHLQAEGAVRATLHVLGQRLAGGETADLAAQLPPVLAEVLPASGPGERFGVDEFYQRVAEQEGCNTATARQHARAVAAALKVAVTDGELRTLQSQLPGDYAELFATAGPVH